MMGDGGSKGDPYNFAQNKKSLLGKIMRIDVDNLPSQCLNCIVSYVYCWSSPITEAISGDEEIVKLGRWGNYSVPADNPYREDGEMQPEIWAYGFRNPWRCSFDSNRPSYFLCTDVGEVQDAFLFNLPNIDRKLTGSIFAESIWRNQCHLQGWKLWLARVRRSSCLSASENSWRQHFCQFHWSHLPCAWIQSLRD